MSEVGDMPLRSCVDADADAATEAMRGFRPGRWRRRE